MDPQDSEVVFITEITDRKIQRNPKDLPSSLQQSNGEICEDNYGVDIGEDGADEVPDFDDAELEVLDTWEDADDLQEEEENLREINKHSSPSVHHEGNIKLHNHEDTGKRQGCISSHGSDKTVSIDNIRNVDNIKATDHERSSPKQSINENMGVSKESSQKLISLSSTNCCSVPENDLRNTSAEKCHGIAEDNKFSIRNIPQSRIYRKRPNIPSDSTEIKVDKFLKEIALQHPKIMGLQDALDDRKACEPVISDSSKDSCPRSLKASIVGSSHQVSGLDTRVSLDKTSTSQVATTPKENKSKQSEISPREVSSRDSRAQNMNIGTGRNLKSQPSGRSRLEKTHPYEGDRGKRSRPSTNYSKKDSRSPPFKARRASPTKSFSISPSLSPRSRHLSRSPVPNPRVPHVSDYNYTPSNTAAKFLDRHIYEPTPGERNRYHRSPVQEPSLVRELSRSLSRERLRRHSRSRSRSRGRQLVQHRSRSRHRYSSKEERHKRYQSRSAVRRPRSRSESRSWSPRYARQRSPARDGRIKRARLSRSRSRSPWKSSIEAPSSEWQLRYQNLECAPVADEVQLEHDMERFIATNMAATGLIPPPISDVRSWYEAEVKSQNTEKLQNSPVIGEPPVNSLQGGMPLPPPPPDISELITGDDLKGPSTSQEMSPKVSLSSLLESAVRGCPNKVIIERCQDAIMKLHDVSIKPGRFAVVPSIKVPQAEPFSTFQPWQSVLKRFLATKIHINYCKLTEQPVLWNSTKPKLNVVKNVTPSPKDAAPSSFTQAEFVNSSSQDCTALLDKIAFLTRELQEMRQRLDKKADKRSVGIQTSPINTCTNCCGRSSSSLAYKPTLGALSPTSTPTSSCTDSVSSRAAPTNYGSELLPAHKPVPPSSQAAALKHTITASSEPTSKLVPAPEMPAMPKQVAAAPNPSSAAMIGELKSSAATVPMTPQMSSSLPSSSSSQSTQQASSSTSNQPSNWLSTQQPFATTLSGKSSAPREAAFVQVLSSSNSSHNNAKDQGGATKILKKTATATNSIPPLMSTQVQMGPMCAADYDLSKYLMIGDEHMADLLSYLRTVGINCKLNAKYCSMALTVDTLMKAVSTGPLQKQIVVLLGLYNGFFNSKVLCKYQNLVGYLRKRCSHLVLIEPPPIPKWGSKENAWDSFSKMQSTFAPIKCGNVSVVHVRPLLLLESGSPNGNLFINSQRLNNHGLELISNELQKVIAAAKKAKFG